MAAQPSVAQRSKRPNQAPDADDALLVRALQFQQWARRNALWIVVALVVAIVAAVALVMVRARAEGQREAAAAEFIRLEQTVAAQEPTQAVPALQAYIARFEGTTYADEARLALARLHLEQNQPAEAVSVLKPVAAGIGDSPLGVTGALLLADAQQAAGNRSEAIETYLLVAERARLNLYREQALSNAALLYGMEGQHAEAADLYRQLVGMTEEETAERGLYEMRLAEQEALVAAQ